LPQEHIRGTAYCLYSLSNYIDTNNDILLLWGDIALIPAKYLLTSLLVHERYSADITFPTRYKQNPYVAFIRDENGVFTEIHHANEKEQFEGWAEQDALCFVMKKGMTSQLENFLSYEKKNRTNNEYDFVHFIPYYASHPGSRVIGLPICKSELVQGINTISKAQSINEFLSKLSAEEYEAVFCFFQ